jgi:hypothetical protein
MPSIGVGIADADGDGHLEIILEGMLTRTTGSKSLAVQNGSFNKTFFPVSIITYGRQLAETGDGAQSPGQPAYFARNSVSERMDFSLSSDKPRSSSSRTRPSYKSLPNACASCEYR